MKDSNFLKENNARHFWHPMGPPSDSIDNPPWIINEASGVRIKDIDGHEVIDGVGGLWCVNLGYSCDPIKKAVAAQLERLPYYSVFAGSSTDIAIELSYELRNFLAEDGMERAFFTSGGSDSVETALRLARQYHKIRGEHQRTKFFSLKKGYHGTHFGGASVNGNNRFRILYEPMLAGCFQMTAPYTYRNPYYESDPAKLSAMILSAIEDEIAFQSADTIAAFIMEPILGAGGVIVPHESFMPGIRALCDKHGILLIADEVITGFGRTGDWTGSRHWGVKPDMMSMAKGITSGYVPFGACMIGEKVTEVFESDRTGNASIGHGYTYSAHPIGSAAALATLNEYRRNDIRPNAAARGTQLYEGLKALADKYDLIGDVRGGHGLMTGVELVSDRATKKPCDPTVGKRVQKVAYDNGAMIRVSGHNILLSPPLTLTEADVNTIISAIDKGLAAEG